MATYVIRSFGSVLAINTTPPPPTQSAVYVMRSFGSVLILNTTPSTPTPPQYISVTWVTRDGKVTWLTRDEVATWKTRS